MEIVYFGNDWAAENRTSSHHIAERLGRRIRTLYVDTPGLRTPTASGRDLRRMVRKMAQMAERPVAIGPTMWRMTMPQIPFRRLPGVPALNRHLGPWLVRRALRSLGFHRPLLWFVVPHAATVMGKLGECGSVYYCIDDYASFPGVDAGAVQWMDDLLTRQAGVLFVSSPVLFEKKRTLNTNTHFSPHGVDVDLFGQAMDEALPLPEPARGLRKPVIGYFGVLGGWTDLELLAFIARQRPDWTLLLIGHAPQDLGELAQLPNVVLPGPVPYKTLPAWAKAFDVAVIPYLETRQVLHANPLKLREYLATGKPVVSTWTPEVERFAHVVRIARDKEQYLSAIERALTEDCPEAREQRLAAVRPMSWDARVEQALAVVRQRFAQLD
jgi:glycosyltransferase involved in cell wall biosynthesis